MYLRKIASATKLHQQADLSCWEACDIRRIVTMEPHIHVRDYVRVCCELQKRFGFLQSLTGIIDVSLEIDIYPFDHTVKAGLEKSAPSARLALEHRAKVPSAELSADQKLSIAHSTFASAQDPPLRHKSKQEARDNAADKGQHFVDKVSVLIIVQEPNSERQQAQRHGCEEGHRIPQIHPIEAQGNHCNRCPHGDDERLSLPVRLAHMSDPLPAPWLDARRWLWWWQARVLPACRALAPLDFGGGESSGACSRSRARPEHQRQRHACMQRRRRPAHSSIKFVSTGERTTVFLDVERFNINEHGDPPADPHPGRPLRGVGPVRSARPRHQWRGQPESAPIPEAARLLIAFPAPQADRLADLQCERWRPRRVGMSVMDADAPFPTLYTPWRPCKHRRNA